MDPTPRCAAVGRRRPHTWVARPARATRRALLTLVCAAAVLASCAKARRTEPPPPTSEPQYGGELNVATVYYTLSALSWDPTDWAWKTNHDTGQFYEQLISADLQKSRKYGGPYTYRAEAFFPDDALRGELATHWEWEDERTVVFHLRRDAMIVPKAGIVDQPRPIDAHDVVDSFERSKASPKIITTYYDHIDRVEARDDFTVVFHFNSFNAEWAYRWGYGFYSAIVPREVAAAGAKDWRNATGSGPFMLTDYIQGNLHEYSRNEGYWDTTPLAGKDWKIPFVDRLNYRIIKDEATALTAVRTAKVDIYEAIRWIAVDHLKESTPELRWQKFLSTNGNFVALRTDQEPFDDVRVRRALNLAVDHQEIVDVFYGGNGEVFSYPMTPDFPGYYQNLEDLPEAARELYEHKPDEARRLLASAGYPDGFEFTIQVNANNPDHVDLIPLVVSYLADVGVTAKIEMLEYAAHLSRMTSKTHAAGYMLASGHTSPTTSLRKNFTIGQTWNPSMWESEEYDAQILELLGTRDEKERQEIVKRMTAEMVEQAPYIWLPSQYLFVAWWPWVQNYGAELRAGAARPGPIYARIWIDQEMKRAMGF